VTLYLGTTEPDEVSPAAHHLQLVADADRPLIDGNHVFVSVSAAGEPGRAPKGQRALTLSTHIAAAPLAAMGADEQGVVVQKVQDRMMETFHLRAPEWANGVVHWMPGSPRTFERFTGRSDGLVGGPARRAGLSNYLVPRDHYIADGLYLVGDSVLLGQSTYACALGGVRIANEIIASGIAGHRAA
jgi:phytoene dehydrogenase-like protein